MRTDEIFSVIHSTEKVINSHSRYADQGTLYPCIFIDTGGKRIPLLFNEEDIRKATIRAMSGPTDITDMKTGLLTGGVPLLDLRNLNDNLWEKLIVQEHKSFIKVSAPLDYPLPKGYKNKQEL